MSLESCPKCGYALPLGGHHCRHCGVILRPLRHKKKLDARMVMLAWSSMLAALFLVGGIFGGKHHPVTNSAKPLRRIYSFKHPAPTLAQR